MALTDVAIRNAAPRERPFKLSDGQGLVLIVNPNGSRWWRLRYYFGGPEKMLALGVYPDVSLKDARNKAEAARAVLRQGRDPSYERQVCQPASKTDHRPAPNIDQGDGLFG